MRLCDYGCGREAKYQFKNGKWCCKNSHNKCLEMKKQNSKVNKGKSSWNKGLIQSKRSKKKNSDSNKGKIPWNKGKIDVFSNSALNKIRISKKTTIEQIQENYPTFYKEEEMRYNPNKPGEKEIQVHCKYNKCQNSKENSGWFIPTPEQFRARRDALEHDDGNDGCYFYCSEECKQECCLFNVISDPNVITKFKKYNKTVYKETHKTLKKFFNKIENIELQGKKFGYELDHKYSIYDGFKNNVDPKIISHWRNLEIITMKENRKKKENSSITLEELLKNIERREG